MISKDKLLWAYSTLAWVCGVIDAFCDTTDSKGAKELLESCDMKLTEVGNVLHNELLSDQRVKGDA